MRLGPFVDAYESITINISSSGNFSAGQPALKLTKIGNVVTLHFSTLAHSSGSTPITSAGVIPVGYRPLTDTYNIHEMSGSRVVICRALDDGSFGFIYRDWTGSASAQTSALGGSMTWIA